MDKECTKVPSPPSILPTVSSKEIIELLKVQKNKGQELLENTFLSLKDVEYWNTLTKEILNKAFGPNSEYISSVIYSQENKAYPLYEPESILEKDRRKNFQLTLERLGYYMRHLQNQDEESSKTELSPKEKSTNRQEGQGISGKLVLDEKRKELSIIKEENKTEIIEKTKNIEKSNNQKVLIIHGQDEEKKETIASFLTKLGLEPVIPHEESRHGINLMDKFLESGVSFAIILLTGDEYGYPKGRPEESKPRSQQNVIFELGFLTGRLRQNLFCTLYEEGLDLPSEYQGNVFIPYDLGGLWKVLTARAMKIANVDLDMNKAI